MQISKNKIIRILLGVLMGLAFGFLIDHLWLSAVNENFVIKLDDRSEFLAGLLLIFIIPGWIIHSLPLAWGIIGALLGNYSSNRKRFLSIILFFVILMSIGLIIGWQNINNL